MAEGKPRLGAEDRLRAVQMKQRGHSAEEVATVFGVSRGTVFDWQRRLLKGGVAALADEAYEPKQSQLSEERRRELFALIRDTTPADHGGDEVLWTRDHVRVLIRQRFGIEFSSRWVGQIMRDMGLSPQRPKYRSYKQDPEKVERWRTETYPAIAVEAAEVGGAIMFADEAAVQTRYHAGTTWAPVGQTPVVEDSGSRQSIMMVSALSRKGALRFHLHEGSFNAQHFIDFCKQLMRDLDRPLFLIVDNAPVHHAIIVREFVAGTEGRLKLCFLPPYSPQLNPDEWVWNNVKRQGIGRTAPRDIGELWKTALGKLRSLQKRPGVVQGFFKDPELAYISQNS